jgi:NTE family protein
MRTALVLGAGGVTGEAFHRGVLRALIDRDVEPKRVDHIVGTSAGSLVGAALRAPEGDGHGLDGTVHGERLPRTPDVSALLATARRPWTARAGVLTSLLPTGRRSTEFIVAGLRRRHGAHWPDTGLYVVAVRRRDGRRVVFGRADAPPTDVAHAVAASCAIPGYFHPVTIDGEVYVDGGVHSPTNADALVRDAPDLVLVSSPMSVDPRQVRPTLDLPLRLMWHRYLAAECARLRRAGAEVVSVEPGGALLSTMGANPLRGHRIDEVEEGAEQIAARLLDGRPDVLDALRAAARRESRPA